MNNEKEKLVFQKQVSRRDVLKMAGIVGLVFYGCMGLTGALTAFGANPFLDDDDTSLNKVHFYGNHQSGILKSQKPKTCLLCFLKQHSQFQK